MKQPALLNPVLLSLCQSKIDRVLRSPLLLAAGALVLIAAGLVWVHRDPARAGQLHDDLLHAELGGQL